jgi:CHRD domain
MTAAMIWLSVTIGFGQDTFRAKLSGFQSSPSINSPGTGQFQLTIDPSGNQLTFVLTYSGLTSPVTQAHVHFAQPGVNGGVMFFLCSNLNNGPADTQACPAGGGTVSGVIKAADIVAISSQNVAAGDFAVALKIIRSGVGYANVHTTNFPPGEIRGLVKGEDWDPASSRVGRRYIGGAMLGKETMEGRQAPHEQHGVEDWVRPRRVNPRSLNYGERKVAASFWKNVRRSWGTLIDHWYGVEVTFYKVRADD